MFRKHNHLSSSGCFARCSHKNANTWQAGKNSLPGRWLSELVWPNQFALIWALPASRCLRNTGAAVRGDSMVRTIALLSTLLMTSAAQANWQYTKWGMSPEELLALGNGKIVTASPGEAAPNLTEYKGHRGTK